MIKDPTLPWDVCLSRIPLSGDAIAPSECGFWSSTFNFGFSDWMCLPASKPSSREENHTTSHQVKE